MLHDIGDSGTWKIGCALQWLNTFFPPALTDISYIPKVQPILPLILVFYYDLLSQDPEVIIRNSTFQNSMVKYLLFHESICQMLSCWDYKLEATLFCCWLVTITVRPILWIANNVSGHMAAEYKIKFSEHSSQNNLIHDIVATSYLTSCEVAQWRGWEYFEWYRDR